MCPDLILSGHKQNSDGSINIIANFFVAGEVAEIKLLHFFSGCDFKNISFDIRQEMMIKKWFVRARTRGLGIRINPLSDYLLFFLQGSLLVSYGFYLVISFLEL